MNNANSSPSGLHVLISTLQKQKDELSVVYHSAIKAGEKLECVRTLYITLQDINRKLRDLTNVHLSIAP